MNQLYQTAINTSEKSVQQLITTIIRDPQSPSFGKPRLKNGLYEAGQALSYITHAACVYVCPDSRYYQNEEVLETLRILCIGTKNSIHEDGTDDLAISNFHQPEYFYMPLLCEAYRHFNTIPSLTENERRVSEMLYALIEQLSMGLLASGFHTPNHRWVHTAALYYAYNTLQTKNEKLISLAQKYLAEKIDIDEHGEFSERSAGMYSAVSDYALCRIAVEAKKPALFDLVKRNLLLVYQYIESESLIFTQNSRRKDKGEVGSDTLFDFERYTDICLIAYANTHDLTFLQILQSALKKRSDGQPPRSALFIYLKYPELKGLLPNLSSLPPLEEDFHIFYPESHIVRAKEKGAVYSVIAQNPNFLHVTVGNIRIGARMCSSFFAIAQFLPDNIEQIGEKQYRLSFRTAADYKLPFDTPPQGSEKYWTMDYKSRKSICRCEYSYALDITFTENGLLLHIQTNGMEHVPFKLEFTVTPDVYVRAGNTLTMATAGNFLCAAAGDIKLYNYEGDRLTIKGAFAEHFYHRDMRGSVPSPNNKFMLYFTDFSPIDRTIEIVCEKDQPWDFFES